MFVVTPETPISALTVQQFEELFFSKRQMPQPQEIPPIFGIKVCKEITGYSLPSIYQRTAKSLIPHFRRDGKLLFKRDEIYAWMTENRVMTQSEFTAEKDRQFVAKRTKKGK